MKETAVLSTVKIVLLTIAFLGVVGGMVWLVGNAREKKGEPRALRRLSATVAENLAYRDPKERHPRATCDACRVGKMKLGVFSLGAFNKLEIDNLVVNLPEAKGEPSAAQGRPSDRCAKETVRLEGVVENFVESAGLKPLLGVSGVLKKRFAEIRVNGFALNKMKGSLLLPLVQAGEVRNKGRDIVLYGVAVHRDGTMENVPEARLELNPKVQLVWQGGTWTPEGL